MTPVEFANQYLRPYAVKGSEIVPTHCPICRGGAKKDKHTFALNIDKKTYNCKRGSCAVQGHFTQLLREYGVNVREHEPPMRAYKKPNKKPNRLHDAAMAYLKLRGISEKTAKAYKVGTDEHGNLMFPYHTDAGEHVFNKFRLPRKLQKGERKAWRESDTMPVLYGMDKCDYSKPLTICEGEIDAMACHESGIPNAVSVPSGTEDFTWIDTCWEFLQKFDSIYLFGDNDTAGREMVRRLSVKLSDKRVCVVRYEYKDANELMYRQGKESVKVAWESAEEVPIAGLINLAHVTPLDVEALESVNTGIAPLNKKIGGFYYGDVTVWTGKRGEGKSTMLSMLMLDAIEDGKKVCAYSGELRTDRFQYWADLQAAGRSNIGAYYDHARDKEMYYVPKETRQKIHAWYDGKYWLYDNSISASMAEEMTILNRFEVAAKRYDCRVFMVDNLMTADYGRVSDNDFYRQQSRFVGQLVSFANRHNVHVHLVAHPRKVKGALDNDDVSGSGDITNRAANVITLSLAPDDAEHSVTLDVIKNRWEGNCGAIGLNYCDVSRRIYFSKTGDVMRYGWQDVVPEYEEVTISDDDLPWEN